MSRVGQSARAGISRGVVAWALVVATACIAVVPAMRALQSRGEPAFVSVTPLSAGLAGPPGGSFLDGYGGRTWFASRGEAPAPPALATRRELVGWLAEHYSALLPDVPAEERAEDRDARVQALQLVGSPPLRLSVVAGQGLVLRSVPPPAD